MGVQNLSEFLRFLQFVPYRLPRIWGIVTGSGDRDPPSPVADIFDLLHGIETEKPVKVYKLDAVSRSYIHSHGYQAFCPHTLADILAGLPIRREQYEFIDLGCGKGRAMIVAHEIGFRRVTGVELSPGLCRSAERNLAACQISSRVHCQDAAAFSPPAGPCVLYLYNPFRAKVLGRLVRNIERRLKESTADLWVVYVSPKFRRILDGSRQLRLVGEDANAAIYRASRSPAQRSLGAPISRLAKGNAPIAKPPLETTATSTL